MKRKTRSDRLSEETRKTIYDFWCLPENSRQTGNKKDVGRIRVGPKTYCSHELLILEKTQSEVFLSFQQSHRGVKVFAWQRRQHTEKVTGNRYLQQQVVRSFRRAGLMKYGLHFSNVRCDTLTPRWLCWNERNTSLCVFSKIRSSWLQ
jgi:hypothetical protein